jgi:hypothetical protein
MTSGQSASKSAVMHNRPRRVVGYGRRLKGALGGTASHHKP